MTDTLFPQSAIKDILTGILSCLLIITIIYMVPIGSFIWVILPMPILFYRLKTGRIGGGLILIISIGILVAVTRDIAFNTFYFGSLLLTGFLLGEFIEQHFTIEKIMIFSFAATAAVCMMALLFYMTAVQLTFSQLTAGAVDHYQALSSQLFSETSVVYPDLNIDPEALKKVVSLFALILPAVFINSYFTMVWINILLMKRILKYKGIGVPSLDGLNRWRASDKLIFITIAATLIFLGFSGWIKYAAVNILIVLMFVYFFQGIAVASFFLQKKNAPFPLKFLLYVLIAVQPFFLMIIIGVGLFDVWADFRKRAADQS